MSRPRLVLATTLGGPGALRPQPPGHGWRADDGDVAGSWDLERQVRLAQLVERAGVAYLFHPDTNSLNYLDHTTARPRSPGSSRRRRRAGQPADRSAGRYLDAARVRPPRHHGRWFRVEGALNVPRSPQGEPVLIRAGSSPRFLARAGATADIVFTALRDRAAAREARRRIDAGAIAAGRAPGQVLLMPGLNLVIAEDAAAARRLHHERYRGAADAERPGGIHLTLTGSVDEVVEELAGWADDGAVDGFTNICFAPTAELTILAEELVPRLAALGIVRAGPAPGTLREQLGLAPLSPY